MGVKGQKPTNAPRLGDLRGAAWIRCASPRWARRADLKCILHAHMGKDRTRFDVSRRQGGGKEKSFAAGDVVGSGLHWAALGCAGLGCYWRLLITDRCHRALSLRRDSPIRAARALCRAWQGMAGQGELCQARPPGPILRSDPRSHDCAGPLRSAVPYRTVPYAP